MTENRSQVRVVVTGLGAITPIGLNIRELRQALREGRSGVSFIQQFDCSPVDAKTGKHQFSTRIAAEVQGFDPHKILRKAHRFDRASQLAMAAGQMAIEDAGLKIENASQRSIGVVVGTGMGDMRTVEAGMEVLFTTGAHRIPPTSLLKVLPSSLAANLASFLGTRGPNLGISTACASSTHAVGEACWMIRRGDAVAVIAGGAEAAITPLTVASFGAMRVLSRRNECPQEASRPFDRDRDGFVIGEGAGMLVLENLASAQARGAKIYAEILGYGATADTRHPADLSPDVEECARAMRIAIERAGVPVEVIDYVNAHGTSTLSNDTAETSALKAVLGPHAYRVPISAIKSMVGHLLSASGAVELIATLLAMDEQVAYPTINLSSADPECDLDYVSHQARTVPIHIALKNSFGLGGHNASLVLRRWE